MKKAIAFVSAASMALTLAAPVSVFANEGRMEDAKAKVRPTISRFCTDKVLDLDARIAKERLEQDSKLEKRRGEEHTKYSEGLAERDAKTAQKRAELERKQVEKRVN